MNHIVGMINIVMSLFKTTPSHVMVGHGLVDLDHVITQMIKRAVYLRGSSLVI